MSTILKWFGILVIVLSLFPIVLGALLSAEIYSMLPAPQGSDVTVLEAILYSLVGQILFAVFVGFALMIFMVGAVSYYVGNSGIQGSKQLSLLRELLSEMKRIEYAD